MNPHRYRWKRGWLLCAILVVQWPSAAVQAQSPASLRLYGEGAEAYYKEQRTRANDALAAAVKRDPEDLEAQEVIGRILHEHAARAAEAKDFVQGVQLAERARQLVRRPEMRDMIERDLMRFAYRRILQRVAEGDLRDARHDAEKLFEKAQAMLAPSENVFVAIRRASDAIAALVAPADIFANEENVDVRTELESTEWRPDPAVQVQCARWAMLNNQYLLARAFVDRARQFDPDKKWNDTLAPLDKSLKDRSITVVVQANTPDFKVVFDSTAEIHWRGILESESGRRDVTAFLLPGEYRMRCVKPGYEGSAVTLQVPPGIAEVSGKCLLAADYLSVTIETPKAGERVRIEGVTDRFMEAPFTVKVRPGAYMALVDTGQGESEDALLRVPFNITGRDDKIRLNTTYGVSRLICLGGQCDAEDFQVQHYEQGWLGAEQPLIRKEKDTYLLPFGIYKITLVKRGYARETHTVTVRPGDMEPEIFTLKAVAKGVEEREARSVTAEGEAPLPSMFRFRNRLTVDALDISGMGHELDLYDYQPATTDRPVPLCGNKTRVRQVLRYAARLQYIHRFTQDSRTIPYLMIDGAFRKAIASQPQTIKDYMGFDTTLGGGVYLRQTPNVHVRIGAGWTIRYDQWSPKLKHLSVAGAMLQSELEIAWLRVLIQLEGVYGTGIVNTERDRSTCPPAAPESSSNQSQQFTFLIEPAIDIVEAITDDPFVDLLLGLRMGGSLFRERVEYKQGGETVASLYTYDSLSLALTLNFEWRFDLGEHVRGILGADALYWLHGPLDPLVVFGSYDKQSIQAADFRNWTARFRVGTEF